MDQDEDVSKSVFMANEKGEYTAFSTEEVLSSGLNKLEGWLCAAGTESIHITAKGLISLAACGVRGYHGNAFSGDFTLPDEWVVCERKACMCGGDMQVRKIKDISYKEESLKPHPETKVDLVSDVKWIAPLHYKVHNEHPKTVSWDMGHRCNYDCSYCHELVSNRTDPLLTWDKIKKATDGVISRYGKGDGIKWVITGGEPTIIPSFMDWVKYVRDQGHIIHTTTNGSRGPDYLSELIEYSCIGWSVHLEFLKMDKLIKGCEAIIAKKKIHEEASWWWFGIRIMVPPGTFSEAKKVREALLEIPDFLQYCQVMLSPTHQYSRYGVDELSYGDLEEYSPEEMAGIQKYS